MKNFIELNQSLWGSICHIPYAKWWQVNSNVIDCGDTRGHCCHILILILDGGGAPLCSEVERIGNAQPSSAEHPPRTKLEWWEEFDATRAPIPEAEHLPFLCQTQVAAKTLAAREKDGRWRKFEWGTSTGRAHCACLIFVFNPQTHTFLQYDFRWVCQAPLKPWSRSHIQSFLLRAHWLCLCYVVKHPAGLYHLI